MFHKIKNLSIPYNRPILHTTRVHTHESFGPDHIPLRNLNFFLKVCAFDETFVLFACPFTSTVTYVLDPPKSRTMTAFALSSTPPFWYHWHHPMSPTPIPTHRTFQHILSGHSQPSHVTPCVIYIRFTVFACYLPSIQSNDPPIVHCLLTITPWMLSAHSLMWSIPATPCQPYVAYRRSNTLIVNRHALLLASLTLTESTPWMTSAHSLLYISTLDKPSSHTF